MEIKGIKKEAVQRFMRGLADNRINLHSAILSRGDEILFERYWAPFTADTPHRIYSSTKSFTSIAIGLLRDEGKLKLTDPIISYFPDKLPEEVPEYLKRQTIQDMLSMRTCFSFANGWFKPGVTDRCRFYFALKPDKPANTIFDYDSTGSYVLGTLVERLSGMSLLEYLKSKILDKIGGFENAEILKTPDGTAWGDSAMVCRPRALLNFARLVMNGGKWNGEQLISEEYIREATSRHAVNNLDGGMNFNRLGYGYLIWLCGRNGYCFNGMGSQIAICIPELDMIFACTGDTQLTDELGQHELFHLVFDVLAEEIKPAEKSEEFDLDAESALDVVHGAADSDFAAKVNGREYVCDPNPMGITRFRLSFNGGEGTMEYTNAQGDKTLAFGLGKNVFTKFPQLGYSDGFGNVRTTNGFMYRCANSAGWLDERTLQIRCQIIDRYFGMLVMTIGFTPDGLAGIKMMKAGEDFLDEYEGWLAARPV